MVQPPGIRIFLVLVIILWCTSEAIAQVPVREEPRHRPVLQNKYIRLLDVWLPPGDTTLFHIHATPSVFVVLSTTFTGSQIKGEGWMSGISGAGTSWYRSFSPDTLIHRVCNLDTVAFHVNDIEILSTYNMKAAPKAKPLPFQLLFENDRAMAWRLTDHSADGKIINARGPMIAELVSGAGIVFHNANTKQNTDIKPGKYLYIDPGTSFFITTGNEDNLNLVMFEIR